MRSMLWAAPIHSEGDPESAGRLRRCRRGGWIHGVQIVEVADVDVPGQAERVMLERADDSVRVVGEAPQDRVVVLNGLLVLRASPDDDLALLDHPVQPL